GPSGGRALPAAGRVWMLGYGPGMRAYARPFTYPVQSYRTVCHGTTAVTVPARRTVSLPRVTLKSIVRVAWSASGVAIVSCSARLTAGLLRLHVTSSWASGLSVSRFVTENDALKSSRWPPAPSLRNPTADVLKA